ncbi:MAG TPA: TerB family tellurite resistance protein [Bacteroidales bacterium]|nr:TerB family tellurite resistance protein [Bacteroidales bacterium]
MGKYAKWIGGGLGWFLGGPLGALFGYFVGSMFDTPGQSSTRTYHRGKYYNTTAGDFAMSLLVLIAAVMKADGRVVKAELDYVKSFFVRQFGEETAGEAILMLRDMLKKPIPVADVCRQIARNMEYASRLQLLHMLYGVSASDGHYDKSETRMIDSIADWLNISSKDKASIRNMFMPSTDGAYKILEIESNVSDDELKKAYRRMARKYHPDAVSHLGEDFRLAAEEKFKKVNGAYEKIKNERNLN